MDIEKEIIALRQSRPELDVLVRTTHDSDTDRGMPVPGWFVHIMTHTDQGMLAESHMGSAATLESAWTEARSLMIREVN